MTCRNGHWPQVSYSDTDMGRRHDNPPIFGHNDSYMREFIFFSYINI